MTTPSLMSVLDRIGLLIGGTQPDPVGSPHFYSGVQVGDGTGVAGIQGCYSIPPETLPDPPIAVLWPDKFEAMGPAHAGQLMQGNEDNQDDIYLWVLLWRNDLPTQYAAMVQYRDSIPALFRQHMQLGGLVNIDAFVIAGRTGTMKWENDTYLGWEFTLRIRQLYSVTYADS
jgi:hypothetical protein